MVVFVEAAIMDDPLLTKNPAFTPNIKEKLMTFTEGKDDLTDKVDFISKFNVELQPRISKVFIDH